MLERVLYALSCATELKEIIMNRSKESNDLDVRIIVDVKSKKVKSKK